VPYDTDFSTYLITKDGYYDKSGSIPDPAPGQTGDITIDATLTQKPTGSGKGWFTIRSNVDGAAVSFDGSVRGYTSGGSFTFEVSTTGSPYSTYSVSKSGYVTYSDSLSRMPSDGETINLYATLNPVATTLPTTATTPIGGDQGWYQVSCNVNGASVYFDSSYKGTISSGSLTVPVYSTGTPYKTYRVEKNGYVTATGTLPAAPANGQTVTVYVTLNPAGTSTPTPLPTATAAPLGSEHGWIAVHTNIDGATVSLGGNDMGVTKNGVLKVQVSTTGTPYSTFTVTKTGYATVTGTVPRNPSAGETVDVYATLTEEKPAPVPTTQSPVPVPVILSGLVGAVIIAGLFRRKE
jgi:hypothetical protein